MYEPWYESSGPSEAEVETTMQRSDIYLCLYKESNSREEDAHLRQVVLNVISKERERMAPLSNYHTDDTFRTITYETIRNHPDWKKHSTDILREEIIAHKPYGSWRGFSTFVMNPIREKFIIRVIREIWAPYVLHTKFAPKWLDYNYSPNSKSQGYIRTKNHYYAIS